MKLNKFKSEQRCVHQIFFGDERNDFGDGTNDFGDMIDLMCLKSPMAPMMAFNWSPIIPDHLERDLQVFKEYITNRRTDGPTDGRTDQPTDGQTDLRIKGRTKPLLEMRGRV